MQASRLLSHAAALLLSAALLPAAHAEGHANDASKPAGKAAPATTAEQVRAEFRRAQAAGELEFGAQFQIAETEAFKSRKDKADAAAAPVTVAATR